MNRVRSLRSVESIIFIDPGLEGTGFAFWQDAHVGMSPSRPTLSGRIHPPYEKDHFWVSKTWVMTNQFFGALKAMKAKLVVLEFPEVWADSAKSMASATHRHKDEPGDLLKLCYLIGSYGHMAKSATGKFPMFISPASWKGQLTKEVVHARIERHLHTKYPEHEADAVGMGLSFMGVL